MNQKIKKEQRIADLLDSTLVFEFLERLHSINDRNINNFYSTLSIYVDADKISSEEYADTVYEKIGGFKTSLEFLIVRGALIAHMRGFDFDPLTFFKSFPKNSEQSIRDLFYDVFCLLFLTRLQDYPEVKSFYYLIDKIQNSDSEYKTALIQELNLSIDSSISYALVSLNLDLAPDCLDI
ncbi:hypothetical protein L1D46_17685 [Pseudoalteromonas sp. Isolate3]|uniref:hypothetical protein n=1 Tax=Pseudoalteromonas sp. Isolate3 TaxID=2908526 RepID=UPI001EFCC555|nr:hypothetical protein [Pseudoalteromonas sp. Isolate3]MCG9710623.1 hypothetical protein [Pseudoalteromonas sp. Isolate3]